MSRRRWLQFSLRFLFAATVTAACIAWWFRPGVVKPKFYLERFSDEIGTNAGKKQFYAHVRLSNSGSDSIWLTNDYDCLYQIDMEGLGIIDREGWEIGARSGMRSWFDAAPLRLKPRESKIFRIELEEGDRSIKICVDVADRRKQRKQSYWSQAFVISEDLFSSSTP